MKAAQKILHECFLGVIDFNEKAAIAAMKKYAKFYHKKKLSQMNHVYIDKDFLLQQPLKSPAKSPTKPRRSPAKAPTKPRRSPGEAPTVKLYPHF